MKTFARKFAVPLTFLGLLLLVAGVDASLSSAKADGSAPVTVVNTPLPVTLSGTGTVTGNVNAYQAGTWSVGVSSLPAVQLAAGTSVAISGFSNTDSTPVFTSDVDYPARHPYAVRLCSDVGDGTCSNEGLSSTATVPVGYRFVIEEVSHSCNGGGYSKLSLGGISYVYVFPGSGGGYAQRARIYVDGGVPNGVSFYLNRPDVDSACDATMSGYLVSVSATN